LSLDPKTNEWSLLKDQFDALRQNEGVREDSIEMLLDYEIHRRIGQVISGAARARAEFPGASDNDYVELGHTHLLPPTRPE
jgi:hypothetical protein